MTKRMILLALLAFTTPLFAQEPAAEEPVGVPADYNEFLKTILPDTDPGGAHDIFNLKNPTGKKERHEYTQAMAGLLSAYLSPSLDFGATLSKLFDQYARGKEANSPVFKTLYSIVLLYYPPGSPNTSEAQQLLREAATLAPDFAYPHYMLAQIELARVTQLDGVSPRATLQAIDKALEIQPDFLRAVLLKCEVYFEYKPPRTREILELIKPWLDAKLPEHGADFESVLEVYARCDGADLEQRLKDYLESGKLSSKQQRTVHKVRGTLHFQKARYDEAISDFEALQKSLTIESDPSLSVTVRKWLAMCWDMKARALKSQLNEPESKKRHDEFIEKAVELHRECARIETEHYPIHMRGDNAIQFVDFLAYGLSRKTEARDWLSEYLKNTDLNRSYRNRLENTLNILVADINPSEENTIAIYRGHMQRGDLERLAVSLGVARERITIQNEHFKQASSLQFFLEVIDSGNRVVDGYAAYLAADTALQLGGESIARTGDALLTRLEKETELKSESQAALHANLASAIKLLGSWVHIEKAVRFSAKMVESAQDELIVRDLTRPIINNWNDETMLNKLNPPLRPARGMALIDAVEAADWLNKKLAPAVKKTIEAAPSGE